MYTTIAKVKSFLNIDSSVDDSEIEKMIKIASKCIDTHVGWNLKQVSATESYSSWGSAVLYVGRKNISAVTAVEENGVNILSQYSDHVNNMVLFKRPLSEGSFNIKITYTAGYPDADLYDIEDIVFDMVAKLYRKMTSKYATDLAQKEVKEKKVEELSISYMSTAEMQKTINHELASYDVRLAPYKVLLPMKC